MLKIFTRFPLSLDKIKQFELHFLHPVQCHDLQQIYRPDLQLERKLEVYTRSVERYRLIIEEIKDTNSKYSMGQ